MNRCLALDPGGKRAGWAVIANPHDRFGPVHIASGTYGLTRKEGEEFQEYKLRLVEHFTIKATSLVMDYLPVIVVNEIVPAVGGGNFIAATQSELAKTSAVIFQSEGYASGLKVKQFAANTIKKTVTGNHKASKVEMRNKVIEFFPELGVHKKEWQSGKEGFDRPDAIGVGLCYFLSRNYS